MRKNQLAARVAVEHRLVADLHEPKQRVYWSDAILTGAIGWSAFALALSVPPFSVEMVLSIAVASFALYRALCFTHELSHLGPRAVPGFEAAWNVLFGVPLLMPSFTYVGVHPAHHNLASYGTRLDPEYLPFSRSRIMIVLFAIQSSLVLPLLLLLRFVVLSSVGLLVPRFHRWLETYASSFCMNPHYRRVVTPAVSRMMRRWEAFILVAWVGVGVLLPAATLVRVLATWYTVMTVMSFVNTLRVLGAHEYESDGSPRDREDQLLDSIDTPGHPWTELWAPVGLRYHALHHYFPGIPYHNLGEAYARIRQSNASDTYQPPTSPSLRFSLRSLYRRAGEHRRGDTGW